MSKRLALLVGMTEYPDERLAATATNAQIRALVDWLRDPGNGRFDRVVPLLNQTAVDLQLGVASFFEQELAPDDLILFYFAGHSLIHHQNIYLATADTFTEEYLDATTVEIDFLRRRLNAALAQQIVLLDCGFSLIGATDRHTPGMTRLAEGLAAENRAVLAGPGLTPALAAGLQGGAESSQAGVITVADLSRFVEASLPEQTPFASIISPTMDAFPLISGAQAPRRRPLRRRPRQPPSPKAAARNDGVMVWRR
ncbi:MAG: caspase family protein [Chloroflexi bacterium]|nr:caspase family protein [Chloroflexota bacterium]